MVKLVKIMATAFSLVTGLWAARELYGMLPPWTEESWLLVTMDTGFLLLAFLLTGGLAFYLLRDLGLWLVRRLVVPVKEDDPRDRP